MNIEVAIPCYNEELTIARVVRDFRCAIPEAEVVVYDNNSEDRTAALAMAEGARVVRINRRGKGHVVQAMFELSRADVLVMVDGDNTYEAADVRRLIEPLQRGEADMVIGTRLEANPAEFRQLHHFGNRLLTWTLNRLFQTEYQDILSGYRTFNRRFLETVPLICSGFEVETEMMIQACENSIAIKEIPIGFRNRPSGSFSKLRSVRDGYRIVLLMTALLRDHRPLFVFSVVGMLALFFGLPLWVWGYLHSAAGPTLARTLGAVLILLAAGMVFVGLILNTINTRVRELASIIRRKRS